MMEDGTFAGEGLTVFQTFTYFIVAPTVLFLVISFFAYITAKETRKKSKKSINPLTHIEQYYLSFACTFSARSSESRPSDTNLLSPA